MDRIALVTGAGSGIGRAVAIRLSQAGLRVVLAARGAGALAATAAACPGPTLAIPADVADPQAVDRLFDRPEHAWCPAAVPSASAGVGFPSRIEHTGARTGRTGDQARSALAGRQPIGRLITPEEVAGAVWFCVASEAVTGQAINVDGGTVQS